MRRAAIAGAYNFSSRFEEAPGTNPEELIAAAEAACYTMTLCAALESAGKPVSSVQTEADCTIEDVPEVGYTITHLRLTVRALVPGLDVESFARAAEITRARCTVSRALAGVLIDLDAALA